MTESALQSQPSEIGSESFAACVEAAVFSADRPIGPGRIAQALGIGVDAGESEEKDRTSAEVAGRISDAIDQLNDEYARSGRSFRIEAVAGGYRVMTRPEFASVVGALHATKGSHRLSRAAIETLAIIAYRQPITRATIEAIRGVACGEVLRTLLDRKMIKVAGRAEELGRPMLYGTTRQFLDAFGLGSLKDLPGEGELRGG
ncbi:MAG: SMC-Scp complex subunit ScpB [Phycisphaerales bacterium JB037]